MTNPDGMAAASQPVVPSSTAVTEATLMGTRREFRLRQYVEGYKLRGERNPATDARALGYLQNWVDCYFGGTVDTNLPPLDQLGDELAANPAGTDPLERLMAWFTAQVHWTVANAGLAVALNFPHHAAGLPDPVDPEIQERLSTSGDRNFTNLSVLVAGARAHLRGDEPVDTDGAVADAAVIGWTCLGMSVWFAGDHTPTRMYRPRVSIDVAVALVRTVVQEMLLDGGASSPR